MAEVSHEELRQEVLTTSEGAMGKIQKLAQSTSDVAIKGKLELLTRLADALLTELETIHSDIGMTPEA